VLIFPNLESGNIAYKILGSIGGAEVIGPIVLGMRRAVNALQQGASVNTIVHMTAITAARAAAIERNGAEPLT
jgi:malate dehydrogenase (oxaloacetate-decarboxylating)(NADP+)